jgi:hypothetical protein
MADPRSLARATDAALEAALVDLGRSLSWPTAASATPAGEDAATRARRSIVREGIRPERGRWWSWTPGGRPIRSSLLLAVALILALAALATAIGLGLPGIRITQTASPIVPVASAPPSATPRVVPPGTPVPTPTPGPLGWQLGLGSPFAVDLLPRSVSFPIRLPPATFGPPTSAWFLDGRVSAVWPSRPGLPPLEERDLGLVLTQFQGGIDAGYFDKVLGPGTTMEVVQVDGVVGYWITGRPHELIYVSPSGDPVFDTRRIVGESLIWAKDGITYRLETGLGQAAAIELANSLR